VTALDRAVLRAEVGADNFERLTAICAHLSELESRQIISPEGARAVSLALAEELAAQSLAREMAREEIALASRGRR